MHLILRRRMRRILAGADLDWQAFLGTASPAYSPVENNRTVAVRDQELNSRELVKVNEYLQGVLEALPDLLFEVNPDNRIVTLTQRELPGLGFVSIEEYFSADTRAVVASRFRNLLDAVRYERKPHSFEFEDSRDEQRLFFEVRLVPLGDRGAIGILRDITMRRRTEIALQLSEESARRSEASVRRIKNDLELEREKLRHLATVDSLTGIWNRRSAVEYLRSEYANAVAGKYPLSVVLIDLDHFKRVNDTYGHLTGDRVLQEFSRRLRMALQYTERVARYGGEEFLVVSSYADREKAIGRAETIRASLEAAPVEAEGGDIAITCSAGVSCTAESDRDVFDVVRRADVALYRAKAQGRNQSAFEGPPGATPEPANSLANLRDALCVDQ